MSLPEPLSATGAAALEAILESPSETLVASDFATLADPLTDLADRHGLVLTPGKMILVISRPFTPYASWGMAGWQDCSCALPRTRRML
jgi:hypothetical protein